MTAQSIMAALVQQISTGDIEFNRDLPYPNIYWCTVQHSEHGEFNSYFAGEHTASAKAKVERWCRHTHGFTPYRSTSKLLMRRMRLGDIVQNPAAFDLARKHAFEAGERDIVAALDTLPDWIKQITGSTSVTPASSASLWERMTNELERWSNNGLK